MVVIGEFGDRNVGVFRCWNFGGIINKIAGQVSSLMPELLMRQEAVCNW